MKRLGDFDLLREIGRGGMGVVYEARQLSLNRRVALKVLPPGLGLTEQAVQRFEREAHAAAKLHHTSIVPVYATGKEEGCHYYAMELIEGQPLSEVLKDLSGTGSNPLMDKTVTQLGGEEIAESQPDTSPTTSGITSLSDSSAGNRKWFDAVAKLVSEVADALHYAHGRGVIHRDIKPANLMLSNDGRLCITDFGLARVAQEPGMTVSGSLMGTPAYMSPEQVASGRMKLDHRTDVYSLGAVLYELLSHQRPFPGDSREEILGGILTKDPRPPRRFNPRIPLDLETICLKAMEKDPDRRYATAGELAEDLRQYLQHGLIKARRASIIQRSWKSIRRHPVTATAVLAAVLVATIAGFSLTALRQAGVPALITEARFLLSQGEFRQARAVAEKALEADPDNLEARILHARSRVHLGHYWPAIEEAREVLNEDPDNWEAHVVVATAAKIGDVFSVPIEDHIEAVEAVAPDTADAFFLRGWIADLDMRDREAVEWLSKALELDPGHALALRTRAEARAELKDLPAALADAERLVAARPRSAMGYRTKSYVYRQLHNEQKAMEAIARAIELDPEDPQNYDMRVRIYEDRGLVDDAIADLDRAIELDPEVGWFYDCRARFYLMTGKNDLAVADARRALDLNVEYGGAYHRLFWAHWNAGRRDEAKAAIDEMTAEAENWIEEDGLWSLYLRQLDYYANTEDYGSALEAADRLVELRPSDYRAYGSRAWVHRQMGGQAAAQKDCDLMAGLDLRDEPFQFYLRGRRLSETCGRREQAFADFSRAIELAPDWSDPYIHRTDYYLENNKLNEALADYNKAVELTPSYVYAVYNRGRLLALMERFDEALADWERCEELGVEGNNFRRDQTTALLRLGREDEALKVFDDYLEKRPDDHWGHLYRAQLMHQLNRIDEALESVEKALEQQPAWGDGYRQLAASRSFMPGECEQVEADLAKMEEFATGPGWADEKAFLMVVNIYHACPELYDGAKALELAREGAGFDAKDVNCQGVYGIALYRNGEYAAARERLLAAQELRPFDQPLLQFFLAMTSFELGETVQARSHYDRAVARVQATYPEDPEYALIRKEAAEVLGIEN